MNALLKIGANETQMQTVQTLFAPISINKYSDRSVQGTSNQVAVGVEHMLWLDNTNINDFTTYKTAAWLAERPVKKDCIWIIESILSMLDS